MHPIERTRQPQIIEASSPDEAASTLAQILVEQHGLFTEWKVPTPPRNAHIAPAPSRTAPRDIWVLAEILDGQVRPVVFELLGRARELAQALGSTVSAVLLGHHVTPHIPTLAAHGADQVLCGDDAHLDTSDVTVHAHVLTLSLIHI